MKLTRESLVGVITRATLHFSYMPLLGIAALVSFVRILLYAGLLDVEQFGATSEMLLLSSFFGLFGTLGTQLLANRELPVLLHHGRHDRAVAMLAHSIYVTAAVAFFSSALALVGLRFFSLSASEFILALAHGLAQQVFATLIIESKARLAMHQYARDMAIRAALVTVAGLCAAYAGLGGTGVVLAELILTSIIVPPLASAILASAGLTWSALPALAAGARRELPWQASITLLGGSLIAFASLNLDRWIAALLLDRYVFGQYAFAWIALMAAQSMAFVLNAGTFPLLVRRASSDNLTSALHLAAMISIATFVLALVAGMATWLCAAPILTLWVPKYAPSLPLLGPLIAAAVFRVSDFWSSFFVVAKREGLLLGIQLGILVIVTSGWAVFEASNGPGVAPVSLAWLAFVAALLAHVVTGISAWALLRP